MIKKTLLNKLIFLTQLYINIINSIKQSQWLQEDPYYYIIYPCNQQTNDQIINNSLFDSEPRISLVSDYTQPQQILNQSNLIYSGSNLKIQFVIVNQEQLNDQKCELDIILDLTSVTQIDEINITGLLLNSSNDLIFQPEITGDLLEQNQVQLDNLKIQTNKIQNFRMQNLFISYTFSYKNISQQLQQSITIDNVNFDDMLLQYAQPIFEITNFDLQNFIITQCYFTNLTQQQNQDLSNVDHYGILVFSNVDNISITDTVFEQFQGGLFIDQAQIVNLENSKFIQGFTEFQDQGMFHIEQTVQFNVDGCLYDTIDFYQQETILNFIDVEQIVIKNTVFNNNGKDPISNQDYIVKSLQSESFTFQNTNFTNNYSEDTLVTLLKGKIFNFQDCYFIDNISNLGNTVDLQGLREAEINLNISNNNFTNNQAYAGGSIKLRQMLCKVCIIDKLFSDIQKVKEEGASLHIQNVNNLTLKNSTFSNSESRDGIVFVTNSPNFKGEQLNFYSNTALSQGSGIYLGNNSDNSSFSQILCKNNIAEVKGGCIYMDTNKYITINGIECYDVQSQQEGGCMYLFDIVELNIIDIIIEKSFSPEGSAFFLKFVENILIQGCQINNNKAGSSSGGIKVDKSKNLSVLDCVFNNNISDESFGVALFSNSNQLFFQNVNFTNNEALVNCGALQFQSSNFIEINDCDFINNNDQAASGALIFLNSNHISIKETNIIENETIQGQSGAAQFNVCKNVTLDTVTIKDNKSLNKDSGGLMFTISDNINIKQSQFLNNQGFQGGSILMAYVTNIFMYKSDFNYNYARLQGGGLDFNTVENAHILECIIIGNNVRQRGGGFSIQNTLNFTIEDSNIQRNFNERQFGGAIYMLENNKIYIKNSKFQNNLSQQTCGALAIYSTTNLDIQDSHFNNNFAFKFGGSLCLLEDTNNTSIINTIFTSNYIDEASQLWYQNYIEKDLNSIMMLQAGQIYIFGSIDTYLDNCTISNTNVENYGSGIYIEKSNLLQVKNSDFSNNKIILNNLEDLDTTIGLGGHIFSSGNEDLTILSSNFDNGYAYSYGGSLYIVKTTNTTIKDSEFKKSTVLYDDTLTIQDKNESYFVSQGGAIYYEIPYKNNETDDNTTNVQINNKLINIYLQIEQCEFVENIASSGASIMILLQNFKLPNSQHIKLFNLKFSNNIADLGPSLRILGNQQDQDIQISNLQHVGNIGKIDSQDYFEGYYLNEFNTQPKISSQFSLCSEGNYQIDNDEQFCNTCQDKGICLGGYISIFNKQGYWRTDKKSDVFLECTYSKDQCLENDQCKLGNKGVLCEQCDILNKYSLDRELNICNKCQTGITVSFLTLGQTFALIVFLGYQIFNILERINQKQISLIMNKMFDLPYQRMSYIFAISKLFILHSQLMELYTFGVNINTGLGFIESSVQLVGNPQSKLSNNLECIYSQFLGEPQENEIRFYTSLLALAILFIVLIGLMIIQLLIYLIKTFYFKRLYRIKDFIICSIITWFIMVNPAILQTSLGFISCRTVGNFSYSEGDLSLNCDDNFYQKTVLATNIIIIVFIGVILPLMAYLYINKKNKQKKLTNFLIQRRIGILYLEYKHTSFHQEFDILILRILFVLISTQYKNLYIVKLSLLIGILFIYQIKLRKNQPYKTQNLNNFSQLSVSVSILSILSIISYVQLQQEYQRTISEIVFVANYALFLLYTLYICLKDTKITNLLQIKHIKLINNRLANHLENKKKKIKNAKQKWKLIKRAVFKQIKEQKENGKVPNYYEEQFGRQFTSISGFQHQSKVIQQIQIQPQINNNQQQQQQNQQLFLQIDDNDMLNPQQDHSPIFSPKESNDNTTIGKQQQDDLGSEYIGDVSFENNAKFQNKNNQYSQQLQQSQQMQQSIQTQRQQTQQTINTNRTVYTKQPILEKFQEQVVTQQKTILINKKQNNEDRSISGSSNIDDVQEQ